MHLYSIARRTWVTSATTPLPCTRRAEVRENDGEAAIPCLNRAVRTRIRNRVLGDLGPTTTFGQYTKNHIKKWVAVLQYQNKHTEAGCGVKMAEAGCSIKTNGSGWQSQNE